MQERRRHARFRTSTIMQYKAGLFTVKMDTLTRNVSLNGACFFSDKKLKLGQIINIKLFYDTKKPAGPLKGKIVWSQECREGSTKGYINGVVFLKK
ncbi:MAG: PilZ domain-containing protein [Candidatus Omnitrophota bacterium]